MILIKVEEYNKKGYAHFFRDKKIAQKNNMPLPELGKYVIFTKYTKWICYDENFPSIRGLGLTKKMARDLFTQAKMIFDHDFIKK